MAVAARGASAQTTEPAPLAIVRSGAAADYDRLFAPRPRGFLGADAATSVLLPDGRILWAFADTVVGALKNGRRNGPMIRNSVGIQKPGPPDPANVEFWWRLPDRVPDAAFPADSDDSPYWYWPGCAAVNDGRVYLFLMKLEPRQGPGVPEAFGFRCVGCTLFRIANPCDAPDTWRVTRRDLLTSETRMNINAAAMVEGRHLYLLGHRDRFGIGPRSRSAILARMPLEALESPDPAAALRYWSDDATWRAKPDRLKTLFDQAPVESSLHFDPVRRRFIAVTLPGFTSDLGLVSAEKLTGPWSQPQKIFDIAQVRAAKGLFAYAGRAHPELSANPNELIVTYIVNADSLWTMMADTAIYYPRFVRVEFADPNTSGTR